MRHRHRPQRVGPTGYCDGRDAAIAVSNEVLPQCGWPNPLVLWPPEKS